MIDAYHGSIALPPSGFLTHFGSFAVASCRVEGVFSFNKRAYVDDKYVVVDSQDRIVGTETMDQYIQSLFEHMAKARLYRCELNIQKPLRLIDCWDIDPIGSAGTDLIGDSAGLSAAQRRDLELIFHPFKGIIYPWNVLEVCTPPHIDYMRQQVETDTKYREEFLKRQKFIGRDVFAENQNWEIAWAFFTKKLHAWSVKNGFDGFVYNNIEERTADRGSEDCYVTFDNSQINLVGIYSFSPDTFWSSTAHRLKQTLEQTKGSGQAFHMGDLNMDEALMSCWTPSSETVGFPNSAQAKRPVLKS